MSSAPRPAPSARTLLALAAVAVAFAAADTYVVVLALPDMMTAVGLGIGELQRATPIVSGFLLGYVGVLPLIGRIADLRGRTPVLVGSLVVFAVGSVVTAAAYDLDSMVAGRFLQGVGGGGLVPATLALVADLWPAHRRGVPLGVVGAVQEVGSVLGPLLGAVVLAVADWRAIFVLNTVVALLLVGGLLALARRTPAAAGPVAPAGPERTGWRRLPDVPGPLLGLAALGCVVVLMLEPTSLVTDVEYGRAFLPQVGGSRWTSPLAAAAYVLAALAVVWELVAPRPLLDLRGWRTTLARTDVAGATFLAVALGGVIVTFASADPERQAVPDAAPWLLGLAVVALVGFAWRQRSAAHPLVPRGSLAARPAWGSLLVSFFVGAALIAALVDIPFFARLTVYPDSQLDAALVLVRFLVALPVGAVLGGWLTRRVPPAVLTAVGAVMAAVGFAWMSQWGATSLSSWTADVPLVLGGLGFGLAIAPVNAALLGHTPPETHGVSSALLVVARMVGMLVGVSVLTTIGLERFYAVSADLPPVATLCPDDPLGCSAYDDALLGAGLAQLEAVFVGAAVCAALAAVLALLTLPRRRPEASSDPVVASGTVAP